jgi:MoaA/NifB/PqqE/SkfB family radical SAM enzyme
MWMPAGRPSWFCLPVADTSWKAVSRHLKDIASVDFTGGGEPLLQPHLVGWVSEASRAGCETGFLANGMLLTAEKCPRLMDAGINWICVSIDGATADIYGAFRPGASFEKVCDNLSALASRRLGGRPGLTINFVLREANFHYNI